MTPPKPQIKKAPLGVNQERLVICDVADLLKAVSSKEENNGFLDPHVHTEPRIATDGGED